MPRSVRALLLLAVFVQPPPLQAQRPTIPEAVARGAVASVATVPSGQTPTVSDLLQAVDLVVKGTVGEPRSYLAQDQRDVYTDYEIADPVVYFQSSMTVSPLAGTMPSVIVTQLGGTLMVNGVNFTQTEPALPPLQAGTQGLFLLQHVGDKYLIAGKFFGAFSVTGGRLIPLAARADFAPEYRNAEVPDAVNAMVTILRARRVPPRER